MPLTMPFRLSLPKGPAPKMVGGAACSGPVIEGVVSGAGAGGGAGAFCALQSAVSPKHRALAARFFTIMPLSARTLPPGRRLRKRGLPPRCRFWLEWCSIFGRLIGSGEERGSGGGVQYQIRWRSHDECCAYRFYRKVL